MTCPTFKGGICMILFVFIIVSLVIIYLTIAYATFEKFTENQLVPKSRMAAFLFTPITIFLFYINLAHKATKIKGFTKKEYIFFLKLATVQYPIGIGLFIEATLIRRHLTPKPEFAQKISEKKQSKQNIKNVVIQEVPEVNLWGGILAR